MSPTINEFKPEPFQFNARKDWKAGSLVTEMSFRVCANRLLIIENISAAIECPNEQGITRVQVKTTVNTKEVTHFIFIPYTANFEDNLNVYCGGQRVRVYADPNTDVIISVWKNSSVCPFPPGSSDVTISGYLVPSESPSLEP